MTAAERADAIAAMGQNLGPEVLLGCEALFAAGQQALMAAVPAAARDIAYGAHPRHRLDLYGTPGAAAPVLLFVHGGGFVQGDKGDGGRWVNAHVGRMAARAGLLGAVMNYRLAPDHGWPAGAEDVAAAVDWLRAHAGERGGDAGRIVAIGTSAGAVHLAGYLAAGGTGLRGAVLLSGLYGYTALDPRDERYYGAPALYPQRMPRAALEATGLPLLVACAEFDPPRFQSEFLALMAARLAHCGTMPRGYIASGHNHYTLAMHLGTGDRRLESEILDFVGRCCGGKEPR